MISVTDAIKIILTNTIELEIEDVAYMNALNRICAADVIANEPLPPFPASVKDGFAIKLTEKQKQGLNENSNLIRFEFNVIGASNAGDSILGLELNDGECVKINTGAPIPHRADAVIQIEDTVSLAKDELGHDTKIEIVENSGCGGGGGEKRKVVDVKIGQDIRPIGFDIQKGQLVVSERMLIGPAQIGICATVGALSLKCFKRPVVGLISTGNELTRPEQAAEASRGRIRDSNKPLLHAAVRSMGIERVFDAGIASDEPNSVLEVFRNAMENSDVVISTGGVSMGDKVNIFD